MNCSQYLADIEEQWKCPGDSGYCRTCSRIGTHVRPALAQQRLGFTGIFSGTTQQCQLQCCGVC